MSQVELCTLHQKLGPDGYPMVIGSEVRLPDGSPIPGIFRIETVADVAGGLWETTITLRTRFGDPIVKEASSAWVEIPCSE
jgi:hypothetical protein